MTRLAAVPFFAAMAALATLGHAAGAPPVDQRPKAEPPAFRIAGETRYQPHRLVRLKAEGVPEKAGLIWWVSPDEAVDRAATAEDVLAFAAPPGNYAVKALAVRVDPATGKTTILEARATVQVESCHPPEPPTPPAPPQPRPPQPTPPKPGLGRLDPPGALGRISFGRAGCTAAVIGPRRADGRWDVLTAAHCVHGQPPAGTLLLKGDARRIGVRVAKAEFLPNADVCWLVTDRDDLDDLPFAHLAKENPAPGTKVWHAGYGVDRPGNREDGVVMEAEAWNGKTRFVLNVSSGDSGGAIFRQDNDEVVGTVSSTALQGARTDMYGGSVASLRRLRPAATGGTSDAFEWSPIEIPFGKE